MNKVCYNILYKLYGSQEGQNKEVIKHIITFLEDEDKNQKEGQALLTKGIDGIGKLGMNALFGDFRPGDLAIPHHDYSVFKDFRVEQVTFDGFRTFPHEDKPFGISLMDNHRNICSGYFLAANGVGKSTIFSGLQKAYTGKITNSLYNSLNKQDKSIYDKFGFKDDANEAGNSVNVRFPEEHDGNVSEEFGEVLNPFFISDYDVSILQQDDISSFVILQLGLQDIERLVKRLQKLRDELDKMASQGSDKLNKDEVAEVAAFTIIRLNKDDESGLKDFVCREDVSEDEIKEFWKTGIGKDLLMPLKVDLIEKPKREQQNQADKIVETGIIPPDGSNNNFAKKKLNDAFALIRQWIKDEIKYKEEKKANTTTKIMKSMITTVEDAPDPTSSIPSEILSANKDALNGIIALLKSELSSIKKNFAEDSSGFITNALKMFSDDGDKDVSFMYDNDNDTIADDITMHYKKADYHAKPRLYYNTFRFKLYVVALKISLAFQVMKKYNILVPIVIDDVFSASDFDNSIGLSEFVRAVFSNYKSIVGFEALLQVILLTHDDGIQQTFAMADEEHNIAKRLFSYKDVKDDPDFLSKDNMFINLYLENHE